MVGPAPTRWEQLSFSAAPHAALFAANLEEYTEMVSSFFLDSMASRDLCVWLKGGSTPERLPAWMLEKSEAGDDLLILNHEQSFLRQGRFNPDDMCLLIGQFLKKARKRRRRLRIAAGYEWLNWGCKGTEKLALFESALEQLCGSCPVTFLCCYHLDSFPIQTIIEACRLHSWIVIGKQLHKSPFSPHSGTEQLLSPYGPLLRRIIVEQEKMLHAGKVRESLLLSIDEQGRIIYVPTWAEKEFSLSRHQIAGRLLTEVFSDAASLLKCVVKSSLQGKETKAVINSCYLKEGHPVLVTAKPYYDLDLRVRGADLFAEAIKERKEYEVSLDESNMLAAISELAAGLANDIKNPLTVIRGVLQMLEQGLVDGKDKEITSLIEEQMQSLDKLASKLLLFADPFWIEPQTFNLSEILATVVQAFQSKCREHNILLRFTHEPGLPLVSGYPNHLAQALYHVINNAVDELMAKKRGVRAIEIQVKKDASASVTVTVEDSGLGIEPEVMPAIFRPYFSTKNGHSGLGLTAALIIIRRHGGTITVSSAPKEGTTFTITLPVLES